MEGAAKETVIIVHGTWAAPEPGKGLWYQPVTGVAAAQPLFTAKLDAALQERGSPARCWAHCSRGDQIFQWSGANSWIARTRAASALGNYVAKLQKEGWRCHIVAHSHGGNIVVEALPQIMTAAGANGLLGKIVTLGTPFGWLPEVFNVQLLCDQPGRKPPAVRRAIAVRPVAEVCAASGASMPCRRMHWPWISKRVAVAIWGCFSFRCSHIRRRS
jgi:hypothetical protein